MYLSERHKDEPGKTITLKVLAASFSDMGVPVFLSDIKGDLSGMSQYGKETTHIHRWIDSVSREICKQLVRGLLGNLEW